MQRCCSPDSASLVGARLETQESAIAKPCLTVGRHATSTTNHHHFLCVPGRYQHILAGFRESSLL
ncbi:hypothetical protein V6Z11_A12G167900 [Gossypium hirsutum]